MKSRGVAKKKKTLGRPRFYRDAMVKNVAVRLTGDQSDALSTWCVDNAVPLVTMLREAALERAGISPFAPVRSPVVLGTTGNHPVPVKLTLVQYAALERVASKVSMPVSQYLREAALTKIGRGDLGLAGKLQEMTAQQRGLT